jgi:hypothetical protein
MTNATGTPLSAGGTVSKKTNPWIIVILVIVLICCGCFGVVGLLVGFWDPIRQAFGFSSLLPVLAVLA